MDDRQAQAILCLGSNLDREENMERAASRLRARFVSIRFADAVYTEALDCPVPAAFLNQVAFLTCPDTLEQVRGALKEIERALGRRPEDKALGRVPVDIDLLWWNGVTLKEDDMRRAYVVSGIRSLLPIPGLDTEGLGPWLDAPAGK